MKSSVLGTAVFRIRPSVLFRATNGLSTRSGPKVGIQLLNLTDQSMYEFKGPSAHLWLLLDGIRSIDKIIGICKKTLRKNNAKFTVSALKFFKDLKEADLIYEVSPPLSKDDRADDMKEFLKRIKNAQSERRPSPPFRSIKVEPGDPGQIKKVRKYFLDKFKDNVRVKIKRSLPIATHKNIHFFSSEIYFPGHKKRETGFGTSLSIEGAALAATGEALERSFSDDVKPDIFSASYNDNVNLNKKSLDPESFQIYDADQEIVRNKEVVSFTRETKTNWTLFENAFQHDQILIPSVFNGNLPSEDQAPILFEMTSTGCAFYSDPHTAKLKATLELIERDHVLFYWRTRNTPSLIDLSKPNDRVGYLLETLGDMRKRIKFFYLKSELSSVTVQAVLFGNKTLGEPSFASGSAAALDATQAVEKALTELLYVTQGYIHSGKSKLLYSFGKNFNNTLWDFGDRLKLYGDQPRKQAYNFMLPQEKKIISFNEIPGIFTGDSKNDLEKVVSDFKDHDLRLFFKDNTPLRLKSSGFWLYRAFSPDLLLMEAFHKFRVLGQQRYYVLAEKLSLSQRPKNIGDLSPWPHPTP